MNKNIYRQEDSRWGKLPYPTKAYSFAGNGCGCCACLHVMIELDKYKDWTPKDLRPYMVEQGFATKGNGTTWNGITKTLQHAGFKVINHATMKDIFETLNKRQYKFGVILFRAGTKGGITWTSGGHYVAFVDFKVQNGKHYFYIKDSGGRKHDGWYCYETQMQGLIPQIWSANPPSGSISGDTPTPSPTPTPTPTEREPYKGAYPNPKKYLEKGDQGIEVRKHQEYLNWYTNGEFFRECGPADGKFGKNTDRYTKAMQTDFFGEKEADGKVGAKTINKMKEVGGFYDNQFKGMDISAYQGNISVANFKKAMNAGIKYAIIRVGYTGSSTKKPTIDKVFENNYKNAIAAGLPIGIYYYSLATTEAKAKEEAEWVVKQLKSKKVIYPVYIDMEDPVYQGKCSKATLAKVCNAFCNTINAAGYNAGVYASLNWFNNKIGNITAKHTKWVAQYYNKCEYKGAHDMWQYTSSESIPGIGSEVDADWCYKRY